MVWPKLDETGRAQTGWKSAGADEGLGELAYVGFGSNLGNREDWMAQALENLRCLPQSRVVGTSSLYESEPRYVLEQPAFLNAVVVMRTGLTPHQLLEALLAIEQALGRHREVDKGPRNIDLDLLILGNHVLSDAQLTLPHPGIAKRAFVLLPLAEIAPELAHPQTGERMSDLLEACPDRGWMRRL